MRLCKLQSRDYFNMQKNAFLPNGMNMLYLTEIKLMRQSSSVIQCVYDEGKSSFSYPISKHIHSHPLRCPRSLNVVRFFEQLLSTHEVKLTDISLFSSTFFIYLHILVGFSFFYTLQCVKFTTCCIFLISLQSLKFGISKYKKAAIFVFQ